MRVYHLLSSVIKMYTIYATVFFSMDSNFKISLQNSASLSKIYLKVQSRQALQKLSLALSAGQLSKPLMFQKNCSPDYHNLSIFTL